MRILVLGDSFVSVDDFAQAFSEIAKQHAVRYVKMDESQKAVPVTESEKRIKEFLGTPRQVISELKGEEILVVHGAPVTEEVLAAAKGLRLLCCARGGPVNIDVQAATRRGIPVVTAPGKNAVAVAELAIMLMVMLARNIKKASSHVEKERIVSKDNYEGAQFLGHELDGKTLGLVGYGRVGSRVAKRVLAFGMSVLVYDPFVPASTIEAPGIKVTDLDTLLASSDYVSLHARESKENENLMGEKQFQLMKKGGYFINTARPSMVDEDALLRALESGKLAGAAMDVVRFLPDRPVSPFIDLENVIVMPHIGGATYETTTKGAFIVAAQVQRYLSGQNIETLINPEVMRNA
ncbi:MAG TPA: NAD(P)-dependent oxidoreductase [Nitrososphaerales archaeon]|nr:NAD(P)-dependent oxidoreductase [Nitrososphaerales archaeon]